MGKTKLQLRGFFEGLGEGVRRLEWSVARSLVMDSSICAAVRAFSRSEAVWSWGCGLDRSYLRSPRSWGFPPANRSVCYEVLDQEYWDWFAERLASLPDHERPEVPELCRMVVVAISTSGGRPREYRTYLLAASGPVPSGSLDS